MEYKLLDTGEGIILSHEALIVNGALTVSFIDASENSTAIFDTEGGGSFYRHLTDGDCTVPADKFHGIVTVTVAVLDGSAQPKKWRCEELIATQLSSGETLVRPNDINLRLKMVDIQLENQRLRSSFAALEKRQKELENRVEKMFEGYDLT